MKIEALESQPDDELARQLTRFESKFRYPLGSDRTFRICHGEDYTRFFRAIGEARCFIARDEEHVHGVISVSLCTLFQPSGDTTTAAYFSDLKVASPTSGRTLHALLKHAVDWARDRTNFGFSVVMEGTAAQPTQYTGRLGIPPYSELARLMILRIPTDRIKTLSEPCDRFSVEAVQKLYAKLSNGKLRTGGGQPSLRSRMEPLGLIRDQEDACGVLEDTRRCKRLVTDCEEEMVSAHLSCFGYRSTQAAASLILSACRHCHRLGLPALFVALPSHEYKAVLNELSLDGVIEAPATVFGYGLPHSADWGINTSEI